MIPPNELEPTLQLLRAHERRLQELRKQAALRGYDTPTEVNLEIAELERTTTLIRGSIGSYSAEIYNTLPAGLRTEVLLTEQRLSRNTIQSAIETKIDELCVSIEKRFDDMRWWMRVYGGVLFILAIFVALLVDRYIFR